MLDRLGNVVYWACTAAAVLWAVFALYGFATANHPNLGMGFVIAGLISIPLWLAGLAVRYILSGR
jgi:hypothetical protein